MYQRASTRSSAGLNIFPLLPAKEEEQAMWDQVGAALHVPAGATSIPNSLMTSSQEL